MRVQTAIRNPVGIIQITAHRIRRSGDAKTDGQRLAETTASDGHVVSGRGSASAVSGRAVCQASQRPVADAISLMLTLGLKRAITIVARGGAPSPCAYSAHPIVRGAPVLSAPIETVWSGGQTSVSAVLGVAGLRGRSYLASGLRRTAGTSSTRSIRSIAVSGAPSTPSGRSPAIGATAVPSAGRAKHCGSSTRYLGRSAAVIAPLTKPLQGGTESGAPAILGRSPATGLVMGASAMVIRLG